MLVFSWVTNQANLKKSATWKLVCVRYRNNQAPYNSTILYTNLLDLSDSLFWTIICGAR